MFFSNAYSRKRLWMKNPPRWSATGLLIPCSFTPPSERIDHLLSEQKILFALIGDKETKYDPHTDNYTEVVFCSGRMCFSSIPLHN